MDDMAKKTGYKIGMVLYIIQKAKNVVTPVMIVEEVCKKTLKGEEISYLVQVGADENKKIALADMEGEIFETIKELQKTLTERATKAVENLVNKAEDNAKVWYKLPETKAVEAAPKTKSTNPETEWPENEGEQTGGTTVTLPDGTKARLVG